MCAHVFPTKHHTHTVSDHIEANVEQGAMRVVEGNKQLKKAIAHKVRGVCIRLGQEGQGEGGMH